MQSGQVYQAQVVPKSFRLRETFSKGTLALVHGNNPVIVKEEYKNPEVIKSEPQDNQSGKSKEDRLRELKNLFEKELITKEEYEKAKAKILEEQ